MRTEIKRLTPALAARMLEGQTNVRQGAGVSRTVVENYKAAFTRGEYVLTHQGIAYVGKRLVDGFHRLTALSEMPRDFAIEILVCYDVPPAATRCMDLGYRRKAADILMEDRKLVETCRFLAVLYTGRANSLTPTYLQPFVERLREPHADLLSFCPKSCRMWSSAPMRAAVCMVYLGHGDIDYAKLVYRAMVQQDFTTMPRSAQAVYRAHVKGTVRASQAVDAFVRALKIFNPANSALTKVQIKDTSAAIEAVRKVLTREIFPEKNAPQTRTASRASEYAFSLL